MTRIGLTRPEAWLVRAAIAAVLAAIMAAVAMTVVGPTVAAYQLLYLLEGSWAFRCL
jgi:hypothetical protein